MATPNLDTPLEEMRPVEGRAPDPTNVPEEWYHPRCSLATEICEADGPGLMTVDDGTEGKHEASYHRWEEALERESYQRVR